ncbi:hypothetical protein [Kitasatospora sp. NPDC057198]|uniref:hypothetical protein n=1 Tax=Kitasatospora sp. NPDC057198 TaxID=3346046 RepID=UPI0036434DCC
MAAGCGALLASTAGCVPDGRPAAAASSGLSAAGVGAPRAGASAVVEDQAEVDARVVRMRAEIEAEDDTVTGSVRLVHREGAVGFLTWTKSGGRQCLGHTAGDHSGAGSSCGTEAPGPLAERPEVRAFPYAPVDGRWFVQVDTDREQLVGVRCGGEELKLVPIGEEHFPEGGRRHYLVFSDWEVTGRPLATLLVDGGQQVEEPLEVPQEPVGGGLPSRSCG